MGQRGKNTDPTKHLQSRERQSNAMMSESAD
jgi:hypothetical protein